MAPSLLDIARRKSVPDEHTEQVWLIQRLALLEGRIPELALVFAIPNFSGRLGKVPPIAAVRQAQKLKAEGRKPGVPDLCWPVARGRFHGLYVEMKRIGESPRPEQLTWHDDLRAQGYPAWSCATGTTRRSMR